MNQPGGQIPALGGAVIVQVVPLQETAGKIVRAPIWFPCVLEEAKENDDEHEFCSGGTSTKLTPNQ